MTANRKIVTSLVVVVFVMALLFLGVQRSLRNLKKDSDDVSTISKEGYSPKSMLEEKNGPEAMRESSLFAAPLEKASERVTKKPFGIYITLRNSPIQPERFSGYHTGTDFEIFPQEENAKVSVSAICEGKILSRRTAGGYGGVLIQECSLNGQPIIVLYGHLKLASIQKEVGDALGVGEQFGILGKGSSPETDGERKHLHLAIHKGREADIRGYVNSRTELSQWLDPCDLESICK